MHLDIGSPVTSRDGQRIGKVDRIIFEAETMRVREFIIHKGPFFSTDPIDREHVVHLRVSAAEARQLPPFVLEQHQAVFAGGGLYAEQATVRTALGSRPRHAGILRHGSGVYDTSGKHLGHLDEVIDERDGVASAFIVDAGRIFTQKLEVPVSAIHSIRHDRIEVTISADEAHAVVRGDEQTSIDG